MNDKESILKQMRLLHKQLVEIKAEISKLDNQLEEIEMKEYAKTE